MNLAQIVCHIFFKLTVPSDCPTNRYDASSSSDRRSNSSGSQNKAADCGKLVRIPYMFIYHLPLTKGLRKCSKIYTY